MADRVEHAGLAMPCTRLELFLHSRCIRPAAFAREAGINRNYLLRVRKGRIDPSRGKVAAMVSAAQRLLHEPIPPGELFELTAWEGGIWMTAELHGEAVERGGQTRRIEQLAAARVAAVLQKSPSKWIGELSPIASLPVIRQLFAQATVAEPRLAVRILEITHDLAGDLAGIPPEQRTEVLGRTFLDRAVAFRQLGHFDPAAEMLDRAERLFETTPYCFHQLAQTWYELGALAFRRCELEAALRLCYRARGAFVLLGDTRRAARTQVLEGTVAFARQDVDTAADLFAHSIRSLAAVGDQETLASAYVNLGSVEATRGNLAAAKDWFKRGGRLFEKAGERGELTRVRRAAARLAIGHENRIDGLTQMRRVRADFRGLGMIFDAATAGLELIEFLLEDAAMDEARAIARQVADELKSIGVPPNALRALQFLNDRIRRREATAKLARNVRAFVLRAPLFPNEEFANGDAA